MSINMFKDTVEDAVIGILYHSLGTTYILSCYGCTISRVVLIWVGCHHYDIWGTAFKVLPNQIVAILLQIVGRQCPQGVETCTHVVALLSCCLACYDLDLLANQTRMESLQFHECLFRPMWVYRLWYVCWRASLFWMQPVLGGNNSTVYTQGCAIEQPI